MRALVFAMGAGLFFSGCRQESSAPGEPSTVLFSVDGVEARRVEDGIRLTNGTDEPLAYLIWARGFLGLFAPCIDPSPECVRLAPRASVVVPLEEIPGMQPAEREAVVRWWRVVLDGAGGYRAEDLHEVVVRL